MLHFFVVQFSFAEFLCFEIFGREIRGEPRPVAKETCQRPRLTRSVRHGAVTFLSLVVGHGSPRISLLAVIRAAL